MVGRWRRRRGRRAVEAVFRGDGGDELDMLLAWRVVGIMEGCGVVVGFVVDAEAVVVTVDGGVGRRSVVSW